MRKIAVLAVLIMGFITGSAYAAPNQYTKFSRSTAYNGAHLWAADNLTELQSPVVTVECSGVHPTVFTYQRVSKWICSIDTFQFGTDTVPRQHAVIQVLRINGGYVYRPVTLDR